MNVDETLELDTIIEESTRSSDPVTNVDSSFEQYGIQTHTHILNPTKPGDYTINVNGQELTVKVNKSNAIPDSVTSRDSDNSSFSNPDYRGVQFTVKSDFSGMGFELSSNISGFSSAKIYDVTNSTYLVQNIDLTGFSANEAFTVDADFVSGNFYNILVGDAGSPFTQGTYDVSAGSTSFDYTGEDVDIVAGAIEDNQTNQTNAYNILKIGDVGF